MSGIFNVSKVYDPRANLTNAIISGPDSINLTIEEGSPSVQYYQENSSSTANNQIQWTNINWSPALGLGRFVYISVPVRLIFETAAPVAGDLINPNVDAPRSHFMRCVTSSSVTMGNVTCTENPNQYLSALAWYNKKHFSPKASFSFSHILDNNTSYNPALNNNVLGSYGNNGIYGSEGRGSFEGISYYVHPVQVGNQRQIVDILFNEPLLVSPFMLSGDEKFGPPITGINNGFSIVLTCNPLAQLLWSHSAASGITFSNITVQIGYTTPGDVGPRYGISAVFHYQLFEIPRSIAPDPIHTSTITQYNSTKIVKQQFGFTPQPLGPGDTITKTFNTFTPVSVPKMIYIFLNESDNYLTVSDPFTFVTITGVNITFGNGQNILASVQQIPAGSFLNSDLFQIICQKNGLQMTATQFSKFVGSVVAINPAEDLNLSKWTSGEANLTNLQVTVTYLNNTGRDIIDLMGTIVTIQEGAITYNGNTGTFEQIVNLVNPNFLNTSNVKTDAAYYYQKSDENYLGGLALASLIGNAAKLAAKGIHKAVPYVQKALPYVEKFTAPFAGSGVIGGRSMRKGGGVIGGCPMEKRTLYDKMVEYEDY